MISSNINKVAVYPYAKNLIYFLYNSEHEKIPDFCVKSGLVIFNGNDIFLRKNGYEDKKIVFEEIKDIIVLTHFLSILASNFDLILEGVIKPSDIIKNINKRLYFSKRKSEHDLIKVSGKKVETAEFCLKNEVKIPKVIFAKVGDIVLKEENIFKYDSFVIKENSGCSAQNVHLMQATDTGYKDLLGNFKENLSQDQVKALISGYSSCIVEEKLGDNGFIPYDLKVYCFDTKPRLLLLIDRNHKVTTGKVYVKAYDFIDRKFIDNIFLNKQERFWKPDHILENKYIDFMSSQLLGNIYNFCSSLLERVDYYEFISMDLFQHDNEIYLGEFTKTPGAFLYHLNTSRLIDNIFYSRSFSI